MADNARAGRKGIGGDRAPLSSTPGAIRGFSFYAELKSRGSTGADWLSGDLHTKKIASLESRNLLIFFWCRSPGSNRDALGGGGF